MIRVVCFLSFTIFSACTICQRLEPSKFDKKKWVSSSDYRYKIIKSKDFPDLEGKSTRYVRRILGEPDFIQDNNFIYCLEITTTENKTKLSKCNGSFVLINFEKGNPFNVSVVNVEPLINK